MLFRSHALASSAAARHCLSRCCVHGCALFLRAQPNVRSDSLRSPHNVTLGGLSVSDISEQWTEVQGQYLAFIRAYSLVNGRAPAEADMQRFFGVTPPSVHQMVLTLERRGLVARTVGAARSIRVLVPAEHLPSLQERR